MQAQQTGAGQARVERAKPTWFFEQPNGKIIAVGEEEAWRIYTGKNQIIGQRPYPFKIIGVGKGQIYEKAVAEAIELKNAGKDEESKACLRKGFEDELESARGNIVAPRNFDMIGRNGQPTTTQDLMRL